MSNPAWWALAIASISLGWQVVAWFPSLRSAKATETMADLALQQAKEKPTPWKIGVTDEYSYRLENTSRVPLKSVEIDVDTTGSGFSSPGFPADAIDPGAERSFVYARSYGSKPLILITVSWVWPDGEQGSWTTELP